MERLLANYNQKTRTKANEFPIPRLLEYRTLPTLSAALLSGSVRLELNFSCATSIAHGCDGFGDCNVLKSLSFH